MRIIRVLTELFGAGGVTLRSMGLAAIVIAAVLSLGLSAAEGGNELPFSDTQIRIEVNATDGDAGLQIFLDGEPWRRARVEDPNGRLVYAVNNLGNLRKLGSTELFMESNEPNFEDMTLPEILELLPEGKYEFEGKTIDNVKLEGTATLTHDLPCGPVIISPGEEDVLDPDMPVVIEWEPVTNGLDTASDEGECDGSSAVQIIGYQVIVDNEDTDPLERFDIKLPADATTVTVPAEFIFPDTEYKFEILAIEVSSNQTISESVFFTED